VRSIYYSANVVVPGLTWYNASKAAVINATKTMAVEFAKDKIRFNSVCPVVGLGTGL
jgi:NAD(P)-dependent dehydrogenase (short-subunit alcohol dehydrogenase family)